MHKAFPLEKNTLVTELVLQSLYINKNLMKYFCTCHVLIESLFTRIGLRYKLGMSRHLSKMQFILSLLFVCVNLSELVL